MAAEMPGGTRNHVDDLRGATRLAIEATRGITDLVQAMHEEIAAGPDLLGRPLEGPIRALNQLIYGPVRGVTGLVGAGIDFALGQLAPLAGMAAPRPEHEVVLAVLNGVLGDYLAATGNPLAIEMHFRHGGEALDLERQALRTALPGAGSRVLVMVHGSSMSESQWHRLGHDHGAALARDVGFTPIYLRYNTGRHVSENGRDLARLLERVVTEWPVPVDDLAIVAHSMGGLVARSACHAAEAAEQRWRSLLRVLVCLGTPHHGAPLERAGNLVDRLLGVSRYSAPLARLGRIRSAGVTDLRFGNVLDEHWNGSDRFAGGGDPRKGMRLPAGVACHAIAGTLSPTPVGPLRGDGLVPVASALGHHDDAALDLAFPVAHQTIAYATGHLTLLSCPKVYAAIHAALAHS